MGDYVTLVKDYKTEEPATEPCQPPNVIIAGVEYELRPVEEA